MNSKKKRYLLKTLANALIERESIITTAAKAKEVRPFIERLVTVSKNNSINSRRKLIASLGKETTARKLLEEIGPTMKERPGGYIRLTKVGNRNGDNAPVVKVEFTDKISKFAPAKIESNEESPKEKVVEEKEIKPAKKIEKKEKNAKANIVSKTKRNNKRVASN